jgi:hypothetical protein
VQVRAWACKCERGQASAIAGGQVRARAGKCGSLMWARVCKCECAGQVVGCRRVRRQGACGSGCVMVITSYCYHPFAVLRSGTITGVIGELLGRQVRGGAQCQRGGRAMPARGARCQRGARNASEGRAMPARGAQCPARGTRCQQGAHDASEGRAMPARGARCQ